MLYENEFKLLCHFSKSNDKVIKKHLTKTIFSAKGHLDLQYKNSRSTSKIRTTKNSFDNTQDFSDLPLIQTRTKEVFAAIRNLDDDLLTGQISTDQTGRFPILSNKGSQYIMVMYAYDPNATLVAPMKNKSTTEIIAAFTILHDRLCHAGIKPLYQKLDNEAPATFKKCIQNAGIDYQLVSPHIHRRNSAERAIRTFKNHFIAGLSSTDPNFPIQA